MATRTKQWTVQGRGIGTPRANILLKDNFESGVANWFLNGEVGCSLDQVATMSKSGGFCAKLTTAAVTDNYASMQRYIPPVRSECGLEVNFRPDKFLKQLEIGLELVAPIYYPPPQSIARVKWVAPTIMDPSGRVYYWGSDDAYHELSPTIDFATTAGFFHRIKLIADFVNNRYLRLIADNTAYPLIEAMRALGVMGLAPHLMVIIKAVTNADAATSLYVDDVMITS